MASRIIPLPAGATPRFDELYVVSDLHLGGPPGFQIFDSGVQLAALIDHLSAGLPPERKVALLINGDFVDFLAEEPASYFDPVNATLKLDRVARNDPAFTPVFEALGRFTRTENRSLIVNLGNHDLELALPWVREHLLEILSGGDGAARGRVTLTLDGSGFLCRVGESQVLCVHGNEVDAWNLANHEEIRRIGRDIMHGRPVEDWIPNAGSQLVVEVMNGLKRQYPFVDLLKPEVEAVLPTLMALAPEQGVKLGSIAAVGGRLGWDTFRHAVGLLEVEAGGAGAGPPPDGLRATYSDPAGTPRSGRATELTAAEELLRATEDRLLRKVEPVALVGAGADEEFLGRASAVWKYFRGEEVSEVLREALEDLARDRSFEVNAEDATFKALDEQVGDHVAFIIAGHTHLERALKRKRGRGYYFNSGTWARLIMLEPEVLGDRAKFAQVFEALRAGTMDALDRLPELVRRRLTVVSVRSNGARTVGELQRFSAANGLQTVGGLGVGTFIAP